jgi:hypothetical protein
MTYSNESLSPDLLLGYTLELGGLGRVKLLKIRGGGATAEVFLGVNPDRPDDKSKHVAVKVAKPEGEWGEALRMEWTNLQSLAWAEKDTHYFPRVLYPPSQDGLRTELWVSRTGRPPGEFVPWMILVQELVEDPGLDDLTVSYYPTLRLPDPLGLSVAAQYADMLTILHQSGLTCADRKLSDLRWKEIVRLEPGDPESLEGWRKGEQPGHLTVLDWNVTGTADPDHIALDLFRFGVIWYRLLFGTEPRFRSGEWRLEEPLNKHEAWQTLSDGTRQILKRLLHPVPECRYRSAEELSRDVRAQVDQWRKPPHILFEEARRGNLGLKARWEAIDLLRILIQCWNFPEGEFPDWDRQHRGLHRMWLEAPFRSVRDAISAAEYDKAQDELKQLAGKYRFEPDVLLKIDRYKHIAEVGKTTRGQTPYFDDLFNLMDHLDELDDDEVRKLANLCELWKNTLWAGVLDRLYAEALYYRGLDNARAAKDRGDVAAAYSAYNRVDDLHKKLATRGDVVGWIDALYGALRPEIDDVRSHVEQEKQIASLLERGLSAIDSGVESELENGRNALAAGLRRAPGNEALGWVYRLLEREEAWLRARNRQSVALQVFHLGQWGWALDRLLALSRPDGQKAKTEDNSLYSVGPSSYHSSWQHILQAHAPGLEHIRDDRQEKLRQEIMRRIQVARPVSFGNGDVPAEKLHEEFQKTQENLVLLVRDYHDTFPRDEKFGEKLRKVMRDHLRKVTDILQSPDPDSTNTLRDHQRRLLEARLLACRGQILASLVEETWPEAVAPEAIDAKLKEHGKRLATANLWEAIYSTAA